MHGLCHIHLLFIINDLDCRSGREGDPTPRWNSVKAGCMAKISAYGTLWLRGFINVGFLPCFFEYNEDVA